MGFLAFLSLGGERKKWCGRNARAQSLGVQRQRSQTKPRHIQGINRKGSQDNIRYTQTINAVQGSKAPYVIQQSTKGCDFC